MSEALENLLRDESNNTVLGYMRLALLLLQLIAKNLED